MYLPQDTELHNRYVIESLLGHGGFGVTYLARDLTLNVQVAVKEYLPRQLATRSEGATRISIYTGEAREHFAYGLKKFLDEARAVAQFADHPNIVSARDYFEANGTAYMVMRYVQGVDFKAYLAQQGGKIPFDLALKIMMPVMDALRKVHTAGLLHRDISPDNIYLTADGQVKLMDFGAARQQTGEHSKSLSVILKTGYAPAEQYRSKGKQGPWTDVYASAATLYRAITGETPPEALDRLAEDTLAPPSRLGVAIPPAAEQALLRALAVNASQRFQNMGEFQQALLDGAPMTMQVQTSRTPFQPSPGPAAARLKRGAQHGCGKAVTRTAPAPVFAQPAAHPSHYPQVPRRSANLAAIAAGVVVAIILVVGLIWWQVGRDSSPRSVVQGQKEVQKPVILDPTPPLVQAPTLPLKETPPVSQPAKTRFTKAGDGVISDSATGLEWYVGPSRGYTWNQSKSWTASLTAAGGGWRLPTVPELKTLYQPGTGRNNMDPLFQPTAIWVWSGDLRDDSSAWGVSFGFGRGDWGNLGISLNRAFAVRSRR